MTFRYERIGMLFDVINGATPESGDATYWGGDIAWATPDDLGRLKGRELSATARGITKEGLASCATRIVPAGSLILSTRAPIGHVAIAAVPMAFNQGCRALVPASSLISSEFAYYSIYASKSRLQSEGQGTTFLELSRQRLRMIAIPVAPEDQQQAIVRFLNLKTAEIDALIAKKRRLLDLLAEQRAALITRAVTKGLDGAAPLKPSGSPWLGDVPDHWETKRLKFVVPGVTVGIVITPSKYYEPEGVPALRGVNINTGQIVEDDMVFLSPASNELHSKSKIFEGDIVVVRTGKPGTAAIVPSAFDGANCIDLLIIRKSEMLDSDFCLYFMNSRAAEAQVMAASVGAIQSHFNTSTLAELELPLPPIDEQRSIVRHILPRLGRLDAFANATTNAIRRLEEYRTATITSAVTGQIDVRNWSAKRAAA